MTAIRRHALKLTLSAVVLTAYLLVSALSLYLAGLQEQARLIDELRAEQRAEGRRLSRLGDDFPHLLREIRLLNHEEGRDGLKRQATLADTRGAAPPQDESQHWIPERSLLSLQMPLDAQGTRLSLEYDLRQPLERLWPRLLDQRLPALLLGLLPFIVLTWLLHRRVSRPLERLTAAASQISNGKLDTLIEMPATGHPHDEIGELAASLIEMHARLRADRDLLDRERSFLKTLIDSLPDLVWLKNPEGVYLACNPPFEDFFGAPEKDIIGKTDYDFVSRDLADSFRAHDLAALNAQKPLVNEEKVRFARSGREVMLETTKVAMHDAQGRLIGVLGIARDVTAARQASEALRSSLERLAAAERLAHLGSWQLDLHTHLLSWSEESYRIFELDPHEGQPSYELFLSRVHPDERERVHLTYTDSLRQRAPYTQHFRLQMPDGRIKHVHAQGINYYDDDGTPLRSIGTVQDVTERHRTEAELRRLAYFDGLTGLPNRTLLLDRLGQTLAFRRRNGKLDALMVLNLDRFKTLNEAGGHAFGDRLLCSVAQRLQSLLREGDTLARLSADEFTMLLPELDQQPGQAARRARLLADRLLAGLREPLDIDGQSLSITASLGITLLPDTPDDTPTDALRRADIALHRAKEKGGNQAAFFDPDMGEAAEERFRLESALRHGIRHHELRLYLQSQVEADGRVSGAEALVRWQHAERGLMPPGLFIPTAEESGLIVELEHWVLDEVCRLLAQQESLGDPLRLSVNISPRHFRKPMFVQRLQDLLARHGADPTRLTLEVTEGLLIDDIGDAIAKMSALSALGVHLSIDDFGTGYSSLAYLKRLPIDELKIDKTFVQDAPRNPDDAALVDAILAVARHLHLRVVAEGVETEEQAAFLSARGEITHQGYLYGRPEPAADWLARRLPEAGSTA